MTENDLLEAVASVIRQANRPRVGGQTILPLDPVELDLARMVIARVRQHDALVSETTMSEASATFTIPPIPEELCGIEGCTFTKHEGEHTWQQK